MATVITLSEPNTMTVVRSWVMDGFFDVLLQNMHSSACEARFDSVEEDIARQLAQISSFNERHLQAVNRLEKEDPEIPADSGSDATSHCLVLRDCVNNAQKLIRDP